MSTSAKDTPRSFYYIPFANRRSDEAVKYVDSLLEAITPWVEANANEENTDRRSLHHRDAMTNALLGALTLSEEWDGFRICYELRYTNHWPCDTELVLLVNRWSCKLKSTVIAEWKRKKGLS